MKISLRWLNDYLAEPVRADQVETTLAQQGFPIESRQDLPGGDTLIDAEITSNRGDCLSHLGLAREVAAGLDIALKVPDATLFALGGESVTSVASVDNQRTDLCPLYTARVIRGVKVGPSPAWLRERLEAIGLRSINNVVDITNYVMMECGQPLHAFDFRRLNGGRIVVRAASAKEDFAAIDGTRLVLAANDETDLLVIADAAKPVAIAGVMGGLESEVGPSTIDVLLEAAIFDALATRRTSRALKLASDASYRFERGIDPGGVDFASRRAAKMILELAGGRLVQGVIAAGTTSHPERTATMRTTRCRQVLGCDLPEDRMASLLRRLGLAPRLDAAAGIIHCRIPSWRLDLAREIDLIEEVARLHGLEHVPVHERLAINIRPVQPDVQARRALGQALIAHGYHETVNFSFVKPKLGEPFVPAGEAAVMIDDDRRKSEPMLRPGLLPSLLACRKANQDLGNAQVRLFETAACWTRRGRQIVERQHLALLADVAVEGEGGPDQRAGLAVRGLRSTLEEAAQCLGATLAFVPAEHPLLSVGAEVRLAEQRIGFMGLLAPAVQRAFDLAGAVVAAELELPPLLALYPPRRTVVPLPRFPGIERDLSVVVPETVTWEQIRHQVEAADPELLESLWFLVVYRGKPIPPGRKSVSFRMRYRDPQATLRHDQVDPQVNRIVARLKETLGAELRA